MLVPLPPAPARPGRRVTGTCACRPPSLCLGNSRPVRPLPSMRSGSAARPTTRRRSRSHTWRRRPPTWLCLRVGRSRAAPPPRWPAQASASRPAAARAGRRGVGQRVGAGAASMLLRCLSSSAGACWWPARLLIGDKPHVRLRDRMLDEAAQLVHPLALHACGGWCRGARRAGVGDCRPDEAAWLAPGVGGFS